MTSEGNRPPWAPASIPEFPGDLALEELPAD